MIRVHPRSTAILNVIVFVKNSESEPGSNRGAKVRSRYGNEVNRVKERTAGRQRGVWCASGDGEALRNERQKQGHTGVGTAGSVSKGRPPSTAS